MPWWWLVVLACSPRSVEVPAERPNVVVVMWDTVRADRMSLYGHTRATTPHVDAWARSAKVYERAISPGMWTVPAHASLFTGKMPTTHGANADWIWLDDHHQTLAEQLKEHGYATWAYSSNPYVSDRSHLLQGFEEVAYSWRGPLAEATGAATRAKLLPEDASVELGPNWPKEASGRGWPEHLTSHKDGAPVGVETFLEWVDSRERADTPFFAYLNFLEAHHPRVPTLEAREAILTEEELAAGLATDASLFRIFSAMEGKGALSDEENAAMAGVYDATLVDLDRATGALLEGLERRGITEDTVVVLVSDHGEHLGEHGLYDHRWSLHEPLVHVPLVISWPGHISAGREARPVSTLGLFASLLDWTGTPTPAGVETSGLDVPKDRVHAELVAPMPRHASVRNAFTDLDPKRWSRRFHGVYEGSWKLLRASDGRHRLYDLGSDPAERYDRADTDRDRAKTMNAHGRTWQSVLPTYDASLRGAEDHPRPALRPDDPERARLEALGYVEPEIEGGTP